ncbi:hypothetical protein TanjilG_01568 [Lupinus angustifolius]|uniref:uncharacterized protein At3g27210-like n=1 Tax=Lupinus angustifolius TaxID=3871 RepID=UPI00090D4A9A|nr:PREDICTED: uncharacterized protein At3g27210-like [Lupinus angustifolius]OIV90114.1 hypothetical protein TanjilG_01568 [Lupinus angustifolius]
MGSCFTIHRNTETTTTTVAATDMKVKLSSSGSETVNFVKENNKNRSFDWSTPQSNTIVNGSKDEAFFDSKILLDSDCEDDFYSVNGDFTPSRGNTPIHNTFGTPGHNENPFVIRIQGSMHAPSPVKKERKKLIDLFRESIEDEQDSGMKEAKPTIQDVLPKSELSSPFSSTNSAWSSERTASEDTVSTRETSIKSVKSSRWCLPILGSPSRRSFREKRTKVKSCNSSE